MREETSANPNKADRPGRGRRWLRRSVVAFVVLVALLVGSYASLRFIYPLWISARLPADAPRIAFSLDNSLLGQVGITDASYQRVVTKAGGRLIALRPDAAGSPKVDPHAVAVLLEAQHIDGVLLTGGGDIDPNIYGGRSDATMLVHRLRDDFEIALIHAAKERGLPMLGICRGCQILNVALGGTVRNLREEQHVKRRHLVLTGHPVDLVAGSTLAELFGVTHLSKVVSLHGQAVGELGTGVRIAATGPGGVVEAIEADPPAGAEWIVGLQWHPELTLDDALQQRIYQALVDQARHARQRRRPASHP